MSTKNARWGVAPKKDVIMLAARNIKAHGIFGGKTLAQLGAEYDLADEDVTWGYGTNPNTGDEIRSIMVRIDGVKWQIPMSRGIGGEMLDNVDVLLHCEFRVSHMSVKNEDGSVKRDDEGRIIVNENEPYLSFGKPSGIVVEREEAVFTEPVEADLTADTAVGDGKK